MKIRKINSGKINSEKISMIVQHY